MNKKVKSRSEKKEIKPYSSTITVEGLGEVKVLIDKKYFTNVGTFMETLQIYRDVENVNYDPKTYRNFQNNTVVKSFFDQYKSRAEENDKKLTMQEQDLYLKRAVKRAALYYENENRKILGMAAMVAAIEPNFVITNSGAFVKVRLSDELQGLEPDSIDKDLDEVNQIRAENGLPLIAIDDINPVEQRVLLLNKISKYDEDFSSQLLDIINKGSLIAQGEVVDTDEIGFQSDGLETSVDEATNSDN